MKVTLEFVLRLAFFAVAPFVLTLVAALFPITGALAQIALMLAVFFLGETAHRLSARSKIAKIILGSQLEFEAYYRAHPPRPFLYYVFYPLFFPYWLIVKEARREFLLFKGYTIASFALLLITLAIGYFRAFPPELGLKDYIPIAFATLVIETIVVLMLLMPIVTTVVHHHLIKAPRRLSALLIVGALSITAAIGVLERPRDPVVSFATRMRVRARFKAKPSPAYNAHVKALREAWKALPKQKTDRDGKVEGPALEAARNALCVFYKNDEAHSFDLWYGKNTTDPTLVIYFEARGDNRPIWLAMDKSGTAIHESQKLPRGAFLAMKHAADAIE